MAKKGKVLLITPNLKGVKGGLNRIQPPLGLMLIGGVLRQNGHDVQIHDSALEGWDNHEDINEKTIMIGQSDRDISDVIEFYDPDVIGISALFSNLMDSASNIAKIAKNVTPDAKIVLGGNHISNAVSDYEYAKFTPNSNISSRIVDIEDRNIDFAMRGEVDFEFSRLVDSIINDEDTSNIPGVVRMKPNLEGYLINPRPAPLKNLSELPPPARDLVNMEGYFEIGAFHSAKSKSKRVLSVMASRGCPERCTFCTTPEMWGQIVRWRNTEDIIREIEEAKDRYEIGELQFEDDTITARKKNLLELCGKLEKIGLPWCTPNGTKTNYHLSQQLDMYKAMAGSGCYQITLACESGVQRVLDDIIGKRLKIDQIKPSIENAKIAGMLVHTFWILGYPGETHEEMEKTVEFAIDSGADSYSFAILSPLPGTPIYRKVMSENLWWPGRSIDDLMYRTSLVRVDGFDSPLEFEEYVTAVNIRCNGLLKERDPERFKMKYGLDTSERSLVKQT